MGMNQNPHSLLFSPFFAISCVFRASQSLKNKNQNLLPQISPLPREKTKKTPLRLALTLRKSMNNGSERRGAVLFLDDVFVARVLNQQDTPPKSNVFEGPKMDGPAGKGNVTNSLKNMGNFWVSIRSISGV